MVLSTIKEFPPPLSPDRIGWPWTEESQRLPEAMPDGTPWPRISIVTPSYNQGKFLEETIRSVVLQGYPDIEYIIIDGGSADNSVEIIKRYEPWLKFWISEKDCGQSHAINKGMKKATGAIYAWINSDDTYTPGAFAAITPIFTKIKNAAVVYGKAEFVQDGKKIPGKIRGGHFDRKKELLLKEFNVSQPAAFFSNNLWQKIGGLYELLNYRMDYDFLLRISCYGEMVFVDQVIATIKKHSAAKTVKHQIACTREVLLALKHFFKVIDSTNPEMGLKRTAFARAHYEFLKLYRMQSSWLDVLSSIIGVIYWDHRIVNRRFLGFVRDIILKKRHCKA